MRIDPVAASQALLAFIEPRAPRAGKFGAQMLTLGVVLGLGG